MLVKWPPGRLSDRYGRVWLIGRGSMLLALASLPLAVLPESPLWSRSNRRVACAAVPGQHEVADAPLHHVVMPDSTSSSPQAAALYPRVDEQMVQDQMVDEQTQTGQ